MIIKMRTSGIFYYYDKNMLFAKKEKYIDDNETIIEIGFKHTKVIISFFLISFIFTIAVFAYEILTNI